MTNSQNIRPKLKKYLKEILSLCEKQLRLYGDDDDILKKVKNTIRDSVRLGVELNYPMIEEEDPILLKIPQALNYWKQCKDELTDMKNRKFEGTLVSYYDFMSKSVDVLARYTRNNNIMQEFRSQNYKILYPNYCSKLSERFGMASILLGLVEDASAILSETLQFAEPDHPAFEVILKYFSTADMLYLIIAKDLL